MKTIRYMGNKSKLLPILNEVFDKLLSEGDTLCDLMAGTNTVGFERQKKNRIISNDVEYYSFVIAQALLGNEKFVTSKEIIDNYSRFAPKLFSYFVDTYSDTYFSRGQCKEIDNIREFIETLEGRTKTISLTALMHAMTKAQSTPGHFAQYMPKEHKRIIPLRSLSIKKIYQEKLKEFDELASDGYVNEFFNESSDELLERLKAEKIDCYYLDPPYTTDQYSRFYHLLNTVCKYDNPALDETKAMYRHDRFKSGFCYKHSVAGEFEKIISYCKTRDSHLVISYSNKGVIDINDLIVLSQKYYFNVEVINIDYKHSSQGNGTKRVNEVIIICKGGN